MCLNIFVFQCFHDVAQKYADQDPEHKIAYEHSCVSSFIGKGCPSARARAYGLEIASVENGNITSFLATDIPTSTNATHKYTIDWNALSQGEEGVTVEVDSNGDGVFEHTFTSDSELSHSEFMRYFADLNKDGIVNIMDIGIVARAYGSHGPDIPNPGDPPSENWNETADLNEDGWINIIDIATVAKEYGKTV